MVISSDLVSFSDLEELFKRSEISTKNNDEGYGFELHARTKPKSNFDLAKILENIARVRAKPKPRTISPLAFDDSFSVEVRLK